MYETVTYQFSGESVPKTPDKCTTVCWSGGGCVVSGSTDDGTAHAGVVSLSGLVRIADSKWDMSVLSQTERLPPGKIQSNQRDGFVASGLASSHWSWADGCVVQVPLTVN